MTEKYMEIFDEFFRQNLDQIGTGNNEDGLHAHIKQERSTWVRKAIEFTVNYMEKNKK